MQTRLACLALLFTWLAAGCSGTALECSDLCDVEGATQCQSTSILSCVPGASGCLVWEQAVECADIGETCDDSGGDATCTGSCTDQCTTDGATQCAGTVVQTCEPATDGCLDWSDTMDCADTSELCADQMGTANCIADCGPNGPAAPTDPAPPDAATDIDIAVTTLDWTDIAEAVSYDTYFGACPVPDYPGVEFNTVTDSEVLGVSLAYATTYCWQAVSVDVEGCFTEGPTWTFTTMDCPDPVAGAPVVTSGLSAALPAPAATYTLTFNEDVTPVTVGTLTWAPVTGTGTLDAVVPINAQTYDVELSGLTAGDSYVLTVGATVADDCGNLLTAPVDITITVNSPVPGGDDCTNPATVVSSNHSVDANGHDCWNIPQNLTDTVGDHTYPCDTIWGGDGVIEYTTGPGETSLYWDASISNFDTDGYIEVDITEATCTNPASSLYCTANWGVLSDTGGIAVLPNTTYYIWIADAFANHYRPDIDACIWSDSSCLDSVPGPPVVTSPPGTILWTPNATYTLQFNEDVTNVNLTSLTWTSTTGSGTLSAVNQITPSTYALTISGVSAGDAYTLTVTNAVTDLCGNPVAAPFDIQVYINPVTCDEGGGTCASPLPLSFTGNVAVHYGDVQPSVLGYNTATSQFWSFVATGTTVSVAVDLDQTQCQDTCGLGGTVGAWPGVGLFNSANCGTAIISDSQNTDCTGSLSFTYSSLVPGSTYHIQIRSDIPSYGPYDYRLTVNH